MNRDFAYGYLTAAIEDLNGVNTPYGFITGDSIDHLTDDQIISVVKDLQQEHIKRMAE